MKLPSRWSFQTRLTLALVALQLVVSLAVLPWYFWTTLASVNSLQSHSLASPTEALWNAARGLDGQVADLQQAPGQEQANRSLQVDAQVDSLRALLGLALAQLLGLLVLGLVAARGLSRQVRQLHAGVTRLASGDRSSRLSPLKGLEFRELGQEFNRLLDSLALQERKLTELAKMQGWQETARFLSHQIKNPLASMGLAARNLEALGVLATPLAKQNAEILSHEADKLLLLVNRLRELTGFGELNLQTVDVAGLVEGVVGGLSLGGLKLTWQGPRPWCVTGDRLLLEQVFRNLCVNSSEAAGGPVEVKLRCEGVILWFEDSVTGADPLLPTRLFQPPFTTKATGTGLGLSFCRRILHLHGGELTADLNDRGGLRLKLTFSEGPDAAHSGR